MQQTICVVGISGFVGSHVTAELLRRGYSVRGILRSTSADKSRSLFDQLSVFVKPACQLTLHSADLTNQQSLSAAMRGCPGVVMFADNRVWAVSSGGWTPCLRA